MSLTLPQLVTRLLLAGSLLLILAGCIKTASQTIETSETTQTEDRKQPRELPFEPDASLAPTEPPNVPPPTYPPPTE